MAPIVHGLELQYRTQVDFLYLDVQDPRTNAAKARFGFSATPHFFLLDGQGNVLGEWQGVTQRRMLENGILAAMGRAP